MELTRKSDKFVKYAREISSRGMSFWIVILGVILQASHTTLLMYNVSAFDSNFIKGLVSLGIGLFVSMALAIFTLKHDGKNREIGHLINVFFYFEIFTNLFYYFNSIIFKKGFDNVIINDWLFLMASLPFAYIIPYAIKKFAGVIRADETLQFGSIDIIPSEIENVDPETLEEFKKLQTEKTELMIDEIKNLEKQVVKKGETISVTSETGKMGSLKINDQYEEPVEIEEAIEAEETNETLTMENSND